VLTQTDGKHLNTLQACK